MRDCDWIILLFVVFVTVVMCGLTAVQVSSLTYRMKRVEHTLMLDR